jgi:hypothetical protein
MPSLLMSQALTIATNLFRMKSFGLAQSCQNLIWHKLLKVNP